MSTSTAIAAGELMYAQFNRNSGAGAPLVGATDSVVVPGCLIEDRTRTLVTTTQAAQTDGCITIDEAIIVTGGELALTLGSDVPFDIETMFGASASVVVAANQIGAQDAAFGSVVSCMCGIGTSSTFSAIFWRKAYQCKTCIGLLVEVFPQISVKSVPVTDQYQRTSVLSQSIYTFNYAGNSGYGRGPGNILPGTGATPATTVGLPRYRFIQSSTAGISSLLPKIPGSTLTAGGVTGGCISCGVLPDGFLSSIHAVGGASNIGTFGNTSYA